MALIQCPECEEQISDKANSCPHCGFPISFKVIEWDIEPTKEKENAEFLESLSYIDRSKQKQKRKPKKKKSKSYGGLIFLIGVIVSVIIISHNESNDAPSNDNPIVDKNITYKIKYTTSYLNLRKRASANSKVLTTLKPNMGVKTRGGDIGGFTQILDSKSNLIIGWCASRYLQDSPLTQKQLDAIREKQKDRKKQDEKKKENNNSGSKYNNVSLAYKLAVIDQNKYVSQDAPVVKKINYLLNSLDNKYLDTKTQICDKTTAGLNELRSSGVNASLLEIMEGMNSLVDPSRSSKHYHEYMFIYLIVRKELVSHSRTMKDYQTSLDAVGIDFLLEEAGVK